MKLENEVSDDEGDEEEEEEEEGVLEGAGEEEAERDSGGDGGGGATETVTVGSFNFPESTILAEIYAQALEDAGITVERQLDIGARELIYPDLEGGAIDLLPEYLGSALTVRFEGEAAVDHRTAGACTSACLALANMLSADEMEEIVGSAAEHAGIKEDTTEECEKFGPVAACKVPFAANDERLIYVRWETMDGAAKAMAGLHGRKFAGRTVAVSCVPPEQFDAVVDGAAA